MSNKPNTVSELFFEILNSSEINTAFVDKIKTRFSLPVLQVPNQNLVEVLTDIKNDIIGYVSIFTLNPREHFSEMDQLVDCCLDRVRPNFLVDTNYKICQNDFNSNGPNDIESVIAQYLLKTFTHRPFSLLKQCAVCSKYFLAKRSTARYCSNICVGASDRDLNRLKYSKLHKKRRKGRTYYSQFRFRCSKCGKWIVKSTIQTSLIIKPNIKCRNCNEVNRNRFNK